MTVPVDRSAPPDSLGFFAAARRVPEQAEAALLAAQDAPLPAAEDATAVVLLGAGASGWSAAVAAAHAATVAPVPVVAVTDGALPAFVDARTLVIALSLHSLEASTLDAFARAHHRGACTVAVAASGSLAVDGSHARVALDPTIPHARAALGALTVAPLVVLDRLGLVPGTEAALDHAVAQLQRRRDDLLDHDAHAATLARRIGRTIPLVCGAGWVGALAARRWKQQCNANAKIPAFATALPDLAHDEIAGWGQHGDVTRQVLTAVLLRHDHEGEHAASFDPLVDLLDESVGAVRSVEARGQGALANLLDLAYVGDAVSLLLAAQEGLDPGPAPALDLLRG